MHLALELHPDSRCSAVTGINVDAARPSPRHLLMSFVISGKIGDLRLPAVTAPARTDELWRHTCFEAFIRPAPTEAYYEFNFAPSTQWAAYQFRGYREGMRIADEIGAAKIDVRSAPERYILRAALDLPDSLAHSILRVGLSAVIEEASGNVSRWALAHPQGKPDFHHRDCFVCELPAASPP
jgi:hypothetical protein